MTLSNSAGCKRRTKIICTLGPMSSSSNAVEQLILAGMDLARLNFAHGSYEEHAQRIQTVRQISAKLGALVGVIQDLPGQKIRTGKLKQETVKLEAGNELVLTTAEVIGDEHLISIDSPTLTKDIKVGDVIFIDDGAIRLEVTAITREDIRGKILVGGILGWDKGVNVPGVDLGLSSVTEQDIEFLDFGLRQEVDFIALSFVREAADVLKVKNFIAKKGGRAQVIAKIENRQALENIDEIIDVAEGIMVARGDLGVEIPIQKVTTVQKEIVKKCNSLGKPVIIATQMLESMVNSLTPTRAEVSDVSNAVFDGADALMLSEETTVGRYPVEAAKMMAQIALEAEAVLPYEQILLEKGKNLEAKIDDAISYVACHTAYQVGAAAIVAFTSSGSTARRVAKYRPGIPVLAITPDKIVQKQLTLCWGVYPYLVAPVSTVDELFSQAVKLVKETGLAKAGDLIIITAGVPIGIPGTTNLLKVERVK